MKILIVDDEKPILEILSLALGTMGRYDITSCESARQALSVMETAKTPFDFIFLDIQMPEMTGIELCEKIREMPQYRFTPVTMLTAMAEKEYIDKAFAVGATDYLTKPFDFAELKHRMSLAEKSAFQSQSLSQNAQTIKEMADASHYEHPHDISEALLIDDVIGLIRTYAFENYLNQMGRLQFTRTNLLVVRVANIEHVYNNCTGRGFFDIVSDIAEAISNALVGTGALLSYFGNGTFSIAIDGKYFKSAAEMKSDIDDAIFQLGMTYQSGETANIDITVTHISKPSLFSWTASTEFVENFVGDLKKGKDFSESTSAS